MTTFINSNFLSKKPLGFFEAKKRKVMLYRLIFIGLGVFFMFLADTIFFRSTNWNFSFLFGQAAHPKFLLGGISFLFSLVSLSIGCGLRTEKEAIKELTTKAKNALSKIHARRHLNNIRQGKTKENPLLLTNYKKMEHRVNQLLSNTQKQIQRIALCPNTTDRAKQHLYGEVVSDLQHQLDELVATF